MSYRDTSRGFPSNASSGLGAGSLLSGSYVEKRQASTTSSANYPSYPNEKVYDNYDYEESPDVYSRPAVLPTPTYIRPTAQDSTRAERTYSAPTGGRSTFSSEGNFLQPRQPEPQRPTKRAYDVGPEYGRPETERADAGLEFGRQDLKRLVENQPRRVVSYEPRGREKEAEQGWGATTNTLNQESFYSNLDQDTGFGNRTTERTYSNRQARSEYDRVAESSYGSAQVEEFKSQERSNHFKREAQSDFVSARQQEHAPVRQASYAPARQQEYPPARQQQQEYESTSRKDYVPARQQDFVPARQQDFVPARQQEYVPAKQQEYVPAKQQDYPPSRQRDYVPARQQDYFPSRQRDQPPSRQQDYVPAQQQVQREQDTFKPAPQALLDQNLQSGLLGHAPQQNALNQQAQLALAKTLISALVGQQHQQQHLQPRPLMDTFPAPLANFGGPPLINYGGRGDFTRIEGFDRRQAEQGFRRDERRGPPEKQARVEGGRRDFGNRQDARRAVLQNKGRSPDRKRKLPDKPQGDRKDNAKQPQEKKTGNKKGAEQSKGVKVRHPKDEEDKTAFKKLPKKYLFCHICYKGMWNGPSFLRHISGAAHKEVMRKTEDVYMARVDAMRLTSQMFEEKREIADQSKGGPPRRAEHCSMCDAYFNGSLLAHRKSKFHVMLKTFIHPSCNVCKKDFHSRTERDVHLLTAQHMKKLYELEGDELKPETSVEGTEETYDPENPTSDDEEKALATVGKDPNLKNRMIRHCKVCNLYFNQPEMAYDRHCRSLEHHQNYGYALAVKLGRKKEEPKIEEANKPKTTVKEKSEEDYDDDGNWKRRGAKKRDETDYDESISHETDVTINELEVEEPDHEPMNAETTLTSQEPVATTSEPAEPEKSGELVAEPEKAGESAESEIENPVENNQPGEVKPKIVGGTLIVNVETVNSEPVEKDEMVKKVATVEPISVKLEPVDHITGAPKSEEAVVAEPIAKAADKVEMPVVNKPVPATIPAKTATAQPTLAKTAAGLPTPAKTAAAQPTPAKAMAVLPTPAKTAAAQPTPAKAMAVLPTPAKTAAAQPTPAKAMAVLPTPAKTAAAQPTPAKAMAVLPTPAKTAAAQPTPAKTAAAAVQPTPSKTVTVPIPAKTAAVQPIPAKTATVQPTPAKTAAVQPTPAKTATVQPTPAETAAAQPAKAAVTQSTPGNTAATPAQTPARGAAAIRGKNTAVRGKVVQTPRGK